MRRMTESFPRCNGGRGMTESSCTTDVTTLSEVPHLQLTHSHQHCPGGIYTGLTVASKGAPLAHVALVSRARLKPAGSAVPAAAVSALFEA